MPATLFSDFDVKSIEFGDAKEARLQSVIIYPRSSVEFQACLDDPTKACRVTFGFSPPFDEKFISKDGKSKKQVVPKDDPVLKGTSGTLALSFPDPAFRAFLYEKLLPVIVDYLYVNRKVCFAQLKGATAKSLEAMTKEMIVSMFRDPFNVKDSYAPNLSTQFDWAPSRGQYASCLFTCNSKTPNVIEPYTLTTLQKLMDDFPSGVYKNCKAIPIINLNRISIQPNKTWGLKFTTHYVVMYEGTGTSSGPSFQLGSAPVSSAPASASAAAPPTPIGVPAPAAGSDTAMSS